MFLGGNDCALPSAQMAQMRISGPPMACMMAPVAPATEALDMNFRCSKFLFLSQFTQIFGALNRILFRFGCREYRNLMEKYILHNKICRNYRE